MTDFETHPAGTDDLLKQLRSNTPNMSVGHAAMRHAADRIEQLEADVGMMFAKGMSHGQQVLKDIGRLVIVNSPELIELREAITRANAATAAAYEVAANVCENEALKAMRDGIQYAPDGRTAPYHKIRALATPDQTTALDKLIAEAETRVRDALAGPLWRLILRDEECIDRPCDDVGCQCRMKLERILAATKQGEHTWT